MKYKATMKDVKNSHYKVVKIGYCDLQDLLGFESPSAYTCGTYGWNADIYEVAPGVCICTGYRPFGTAPKSYAQVREFNRRAQAIRSDYSMEYEDRKAAVRSLLSLFVENYC